MYKLTILGLITLCLILTTNCSDEQNKIVNAYNNHDVREVSDSTIIDNLIKKSLDLYQLNSEELDIHDEFLIEAENMAKERNLPEELIKIYHILGKRYRHTSNYSKAIDCENKALNIANEIKNDKLSSEAYNLLAVVYRRVDENSIAINLHLKALEVARQIKDTFQIRVAYNGIGNVYLSLKRYRIAIEYFRDAINIAQQKNDILGMAINSNNIGEALRNLNQPDSALYYFFQSLEYNKQIESKSGQAICYNSIASAYISKNNLQSAIKYVHYGLELNKQLDDQINISVSHTTLGEIYYKLGHLTHARENLEKSYNLAETIGSKYQIEASARLLSLVYEKQKNYKKAIEYLRIAEQFNDSIINEENLRSIRTLSALYSNDKKEAQISLLNKESKLQKIMIAQQKKTIIFILITVLILIGGAALLIWHGRLKSRLNAITMQQRLLRSQMNPHFIFNALSAIQVYILENDMENSAKFLSNFAKLMRQVLRSSQYEYVPLNDENSILKYYLDIQQLRFTQPFSYEIKIEEDLDLSQILVPPMISQPFVENAIEHGIKSLGKDGRIIVRMLKKNQQLIIEVEDNGIGIKASKSTSVNKKHESMALQITNNRLNVIRKLSKKPCSLEIIDQQEINPGTPGTLIRITIPIILKNSKLAEIKKY